MNRFPASGRCRAGAPAPGLRRALGLAALALLLAAPLQTAAAQAAPGHDPNWPCVQRKVPSLSAAAMWPGLSQATLSADWRAEPEVAALVARIAPRRVSVEEAEEAIRSFAAGLGADREEKLMLLFVGLFQTLDAERGEVMRGIERFAGKQRDMAERILADRAALQDLRQESSSDPELLTERTEQVNWAIRVFEERRASLTHVCEVPTIIEQRLFALARAIRSEVS
jgi:hypothetical protein